MKTLVNIFDPEEPLAAYLFLKQYYEEGDRLMFISTREDRRLLAPYVALFQLPDEQLEFIAFKRDEDSYIYERISRKLQSRLSPQTEYWVNLAGGTRYLALAVYLTVPPTLSALSIGRFIVNASPMVII